MYRAMLLLLPLLFISCMSTSAIPDSVSVGETVDLPAPSTKGNMSLEEALQNRRSIREYASDALTLAEVSQLLWAGQGITSEAGGRTAPSAGALYPLELYLVSSKVLGLPSGVFRYQPEGHRLVYLKQGDIREELRAAVGQPAVGPAPVYIVVFAIYEKTTQKYPDRGIQFVHLEAGHAAQNICLQGVALGLDSVTVGYFNQGKVRETVGASENEVPLYVIPLGKPG